MAEEEKSLANTSTDITVAVIILLVILGLVGTYLSFAFDLYQQFLEWIYSRNWTTIFNILMVIFGIIDLFLIWLVIFILRRHAKLEREMPEEKPLTVHVIPIEDETRTVWEEIRRLANSANPSDWNMAIIRADGLLDTVLQRLGYEGETVAERLKIIDTTKLPSVERVWSAHRLRNTIVHGPLQEHTRETVIHALRSYEIALKELGVLEEAEKI